MNAAEEFDALLDLLQDGEGHLRERMRLLVGFALLNLGAFRVPSGMPSVAGEGASGRTVRKSVEAVGSNLGSVPRAFALLPDDNGGADFSLVHVGADGKPYCELHGAMNKVSPSPPGYWRCITTSGPKKNPCRAGCMEVASDFTEEPQQ